MTQGYFKRHKRSRDVFNIDFSKVFKEIAEVGSLVMIGLCVVLFMYSTWVSDL